jgi:hypothetical protein
MHLLVQKIYLCIGITYLSSFLLALVRSSLSSNYTLAFRLGQNLLNILKFMLSKQKFSLILILSKNKALPLFFRSDFFLSTEFRKSSRVLRTSVVDLCKELLFSLLQFPTITVSSPDNITICCHGGRPRVQCLTTHQQNPNYQPFQQHLRSRRSLTRGRRRGGYRTHVIVTKLGHRYVIITLHILLY